MSNQTCNQCRNYLQHYAFSGQKLFRVYCGHCMSPGARRRRPDFPACERFDPRPDDEDIFVTKEYLSRKLLEHLLKMELLPEITDLPDKL